MSRTLFNEMVTRTLCVFIAMICLLALAAFLLVISTSDVHEPWSIIIFVPASIAFYILGLVMVVWKFWFVTLAVAALCLVLSFKKLVEREWHWSTAVVAAIALVGHTAFLLFLYPAYS